MKKIIFILALLLMGLCVKAEQVYMPKITLKEAINTTLQLSGKDGYILVKEDEHILVFEQNTMNSNKAVQNIITVFLIGVPVNPNVVNRITFTFIEVENGVNIGVIYETIFNKGRYNEYAVYNTPNSQELQRILQQKADAREIRLK
jgi:hypothetical protein